MIVKSQSQRSFLRMLELKAHAEEEEFGSCCACKSSCEKSHKGRKDRNRAKGRQGSTDEVDARAAKRDRAKSWEGRGAGSKEGEIAHKMSL